MGEKIFLYYQVEILYPDYHREEDLPVLSSRDPIPGVKSIGPTYFAPFLVDISLTQNRKCHKIYILSLVEIILLLVP